MVKVDDGHDHNNGTVCPGCKFKTALAAYLDYVAGEPEAEWHDATGEVIDLLGMAGNALVCLRSARFDGGQDEDDNAALAAAAISRLGGAIQELWGVVMPDDDDPGAGL